jgi:hypothetical protein
MQRGDCFTARVFLTLAIPALLLTAACRPATQASPKEAPAGSAAREAQQSVSTARSAEPTSSGTPAAGSDEQALAAFYRGKTIKILVGFGPGGGYDLYARLVARYMGAYIPGNPSFIVENKDGAGSLLATNAAYATEPRDGTVLLTFSEGLVQQQLLGAPGVAFDAARFNWLGSAVQTTHACAARTDLAVSAQRVVDGLPLIMVTSDPGSSPYDVPAVLNAALDLKLKLIGGYRATPNMLLAIEQTEGDALCTTLSTLIEPQGRPFLEGSQPKGKIFLVVGAAVPPGQASNPWVQGVPSAEAFARTDEARTLLRVIDTPAHMHKPYVAPPDVPPARVEMLRRALASTFDDPQFKAEVERLGLAASPIGGEETARIVAELQQTPAPVVARLKELLK